MGEQRFGGKEKRECFYLCLFPGVPPAAAASLPGLQLPPDKSVMASASISGMDSSDMPSSLSLQP